jgi:hypothetical protein
MKNSSMFPKRVAIIGNSNDHAESMQRNLSMFGLLSVNTHKLNVDFFQQLLDTLSETAPWIKVVLRTGQGERTELVQAALKGGASAIGDCKPWNEVVDAISKTVEGIKVSNCEASKRGNRLETSGAPGSNLGRRGMIR